MRWARAKGGACWIAKAHMEYMVMNRVALSMCFSVLGVFLGGLAMMGPRADTIDLRAYQWSHRLLLVGSPSADHHLYRDLVHVLEQRMQSLQDRDLLVVHTLEAGPSRAGERRFSPQAAAALRAQWNLVSGQLTMVLIGKDGGEKWRRVNHVDLEEIFALIDTMPMRREEMRNRGR